MAATLATGSASAVSHRSAGALWGLTPPTDVVDIVVPRPHQFALEGVDVHRAVILKPNEVTLLNGLPTTKPGRALIDMAAFVDPEVLEDALDNGRRLRLFTCSYLRLRLRGLGRQGRKGVRALAALIDERVDGKPLAASPFERRLFTALKDARLPRPVPQYEVRLPNGRLRYIDYAWPAVMLGLEAHSYEHHFGKRAWSRDATRHDEVVAMGWRIMPVTDDDLRYNAAGKIELIRQAGGW
jgi:very-short-patch-repair endonuclease